MREYATTRAPLGSPWIDVMTVSQYIAKTPPAARRALKQLRAAIRSVAPKVTEGISYGIPTFYLDGKYLLYIAAFKEHVSVYPVTREMVRRYGKTLARHRHGAGTLRFALDKPIPVELVRKLARVRVQERRGKATAAPARKRAPRSA